MGAEPTAGASPTPTPSGQQFEIRCGEQLATIVEVGGGVRAYRHGARDVLHPYEPGAICDGAHGTPLIPWPNRLADGRYEFEGARHQLSLSEPERHNAIHGLLRWAAWRAEQHDDDRVVMATRLHPQPGYPFTLDVRVAYSLGESGLSVETSARNVGDDACPFACGQHPYLSPGEGVVDDCVLELAARTRILTDPDRQLPCGHEPVAGTAFDFNRPRRVGELEIDFAFTDLERDEEGLARVRLTGVDGRCVELWADGSYPVLEIYTADTLAPPRRRRGLGAEPMSAPPNALQSGQDVVRLGPGEQFSARWGVRLL